MEWTDFYELSDEAVDEALGKLNETVVMARCAELVPQAKAMALQLTSVWADELITTEIRQFDGEADLENPNSQLALAVKALENLRAGYAADPTRELFFRRGGTIDPIGRGARNWMPIPGSEINEDAKTITVFGKYNQATDTEGIPSMLSLGLINHDLGTFSLDKFALDEIAALLLHIYNEYQAMESMNIMLEEREVEGKSSSIMQIKREKIKTLVRILVCFQELEALKGNMPGLES